MSSEEPHPICLLSLLGLGCEARGLCRGSSGEISRSDPNSKPPPLANRISISSVFMGPKYLYEGIPTRESLFSSAIPEPAALNPLRSQNPKP